MDWIAGVSIVALLVGGSVTWTVARSHRAGWGWRAVPGSALGDGPFRRMPIVNQEPRRMPLVCAAAAFSSVTWGVLTAFVFAPAGLVCCLLALGDVPEHGVAFAAGTAGMVAATVRGFALGGRLMGLVQVLAARRATSADDVGRLARQSFAHHALVAASFALVVGASGDPPFFLLAAVPCAIGAGQAALLRAARSTFVRLDREDERLAA
ncbi:MAG TPA: hypothetical protein VKB80_29440 [Kofleriaceae bacterium]|nr:hypothetical protein [Kofleriaceae bacterium]